MYCRLVKVEAWAGSANRAYEQSVWRLELPPPKDLNHPSSLQSPSSFATTSSRLDPPQPACLARRMCPPQQILACSSSIGSSSRTCLPYRGGERRSVATILIALPSPSLVAAECVKLTGFLSARFHTVTRIAAEHTQTHTQQSTSRPLFNPQAGWTPLVYYAHKVTWGWAENTEHVHAWHLIFNWLKNHFNTSNYAITWTRGAQISTPSSLNYHKS